MSQDKCTIEVNGVELEARPGQMLIEVTDAAGIYIPRFCYHSKLSIAANCRMCLVEVEKAPKPMPACATPVTPGMKVSTRSQKAIGAQKATMEFLLINHPLDCPICDQGGECELQDLAIGFGRDVSRFAERKRVVRDKDIGPLVSTDMTRCIHCTRCVRFTQEVAGFQELGTIGRGDRVQISPYIERAVAHELSGNIIDLCPVGALNSKPFRFSARAWEMTQHTGIAPHDCLGSRAFLHVMGNQVKRVVPRPCDDINETWLSDRDRFGYEGLNSPERLLQPMIRESAGWRAASWDEALDAAARGLQAARRRGALVSPGATVEEGHLIARLMEQLGSADLDFRLRRRDFRTQEHDPLVPLLGMELPAVEEQEEILFVGSNLRAEVPLLAHRIRKAALKGAGVHFVNPAPFPFLFPVASSLIGDANGFWRELAALVRAAAGNAGPGVDLAALLATAPEPTAEHQRIVERLRSKSRSVVLLGLLSQRHPSFGEIDFLAGELARLTGSTVGYLSEGANSAGLALAGVLPHRSRGGAARARSGAHAGAMAADPPDAMLLFGIEPDADCSAVGRLQSVPTVIACSAYWSDSLRQIAHVALPLAAYAETDGTYVNVVGHWQSFTAATAPPGEARPGWKILRVLGNRLGLDHFDYVSPAQVREELRSQLADLSTPIPASGRRMPAAHAAEPITLADLDIDMYRVDPVLRRAACLQTPRSGDAGLAPARRSA